MLTYAWLTIIMCLVNAIYYFSVFSSYAFSPPSKAKAQHLLATMQQQQDTYGIQVLNITQQPDFFIQNVIVLITAIIITIFFVVFTKFYFFHFKLILGNSTTIENLDS